MISTRTGSGILKGSSIRGNGREQAIGDLFCDGPFGNFEQTKNELSRGRFMRRNPVDVRVPGVALMMVDVDEHLPIVDAWPNGSQPLKAGGIGSNNAVETLTPLGLLDDMIRIQKPVFLRATIFVPTNNLLTLGAQGQGKTQLGTNAVAVRTDMAYDAESPAIANAVDDTVDDFGMGLHQL